MSLARSASTSASRLVQCRACQMAQRRLLSSTATRFPRQYTPFKSSADLTPAQSSSSSPTPASTSSDSLPWYVDQAYMPRPVVSTRQTSEPPKEFPAHLREFYTRLSGLPFFKEVVGARNESGVWTWSVVCTLREGRERSIRAAAGRVKDEAHEALRGRPERKELLVEGVNVPEPSWALVDVAGLVAVHVLTREASVKWDLARIGQQSDEIEVI